MQPQKPMPKKSLLSSAIGQELGTEVNPRKQAQYDAIGPLALEMIHGPKHRDKILQALSAGKDPVAAVARVAAMIVMKIFTDAKKKKARLDDDILAIVGDEIVRNLAEVSRAAGIHDFQEKDIEAALWATVDLVWAQMEKTGDLDLTGVEELTGKPVPDRYKNRQIAAIKARKNIKARQAQGQAGPPQAGPQAGPPQGNPLLNKARQGGA